MILGYHSPVSESRVAELITAGQLAEAAQMLELIGEQTRAVELYERIWDFAAAAKAARACGQLTRALGNAIRNKDEGLALELVAEIHGSNDAELCLASGKEAEERGSLALSAKLYEYGGSLKQAAECYQRAGLLMAAGEIEARQGHAQAAIQLYEREVAAASEDGAAPSEARLALGRLLVRYGRHEQALAHLQTLWQQSPEIYPEAAIGTIISLVHLGYEGAAASALKQAQRAGLAVPRDLKACLDHPSFAPTDIQADRLLGGRYRLGRLLGSGGMGRVYQAQDLLSETAVALKLFSAPAGAAGRDAYSRFIREAKTTGGLRHPNIVALLDSNEELGFLVLEFMTGGTLADKLRAPLPLSRIRAITLQVIDGLAASHQRGVVHRDIKPSNIFFSGTGVAKIGDFGVAHLQDSGQTRTGAFIGTVAYMAPEQILGQAITFATDIYALGITLFQMLTGRLPFGGTDLVERHLNAPPPSISSLAGELPVICGQTVARCLAKRATDRYPSLSALRAAISEFPADADIRVGVLVGPLEDSEPTQAAVSERYGQLEALPSGDGLQLSLAQDKTLARVALRVELRSSAPKFIWPLLEAAANGGPHLQRVWCLDPRNKIATLQPWAALPLHLATADESSRLSLALMAAKGLAPLHRRGLAHGCIDHKSVGQVDGVVVISLLAALAALDRSPAVTAGDGEPSPTADIAQLLRLFSLSTEETIDDAPQLIRWCRERKDELDHDKHARQLSEHLADAPFPS